MVYFEEKIMMCCVEIAALNIEHKKIYTQKGKHKPPLFEQWH